MHFKRTGSSANPLCLRAGGRGRRGLLIFFPLTIGFCAPKLFDRGTEMGGCVGEMEGSFSNFDKLNSVLRGLFRKATDKIWERGLLETE